MRDVSLTYHPAEGPVPAVRGVDLTVDAGEVVGVAGESGCGKSTLISTVLRLFPKSATVEGEVLVDGENVFDMKWNRMRAVRWGEAAVVFQGALHSLNPIQRIGKQLARADPAAREGRHRGLGAARRCASCSSRWDFRLATPTPTRTSSPAGRSSAS